MTLHDKPFGSTSLGYAMVGKKRVELTRLFFKDGVLHYHGKGEDSTRRWSYTKITFYGSDDKRVLVAYQKRTIVLPGRISLEGVIEMDAC